LTFFKGEKTLKHAYRFELGGENETISGVEISCQKGIHREKELQNLLCGCRKKQIEATRESKSKKENNPVEESLSKMPGTQHQKAAAGRNKETVTEKFLKMFAEKRATDGEES